MVLHSSSGYSAESVARRAEPEPKTPPILNPRRLAGQARWAVLHALSSRVAGWNMAGSLAAVGPNELSGRPNQIAEVGRRFDEDSFNAGERNPVIMAFNEAPT